MAERYPRVLSVGDCAVTVELGDSLDEGIACRVRALDERVADLELAAMLETVPTYAALLVIYDRRRIAFAELSARLLSLTEDLPSSGVPGRLVEIQALYDGDDLDEIARVCGLTRDDVVEMHAGRDYSVLMLGFSPGFAYMGFVDERLRMPRRKTPRTRVSSGSIAIAGAQTGVYPRALPGGWNLLGRSSLQLFDPANRDPSALMPGDRVRFLPTAVLEPPVTVPRLEYRGLGVEVLEPGILTTIQDAGRPGLRRVAVPLTGFADPAAARRANVCVGNSEGAPLFELCAPGLRLRFEKATFIALAGASTSARLERSDLGGGHMTIPMNVAVRVRPSNTLTITGLQGGARAYLAVAGMQAPMILGSASVDLGSGFLRPLDGGDRLSVGSVDSDRVRRAALNEAPRKGPVRVILGPQLHHFDEGTVATFLSTAWRVGLDSDRVGARLDGPRLRHEGPAEIVSDGMVPGCIQVPPDGRPIVMLSDCPTTGGYPKIACVVSADLALLAQAIPGETSIQFAAVRIEDL